MEAGDINIIQQKIDSIKQLIIKSDFKSAIEELQASGPMVYPYDIKINILHAEVLRETHKLPQAQKLMNQTIKKLKEIDIEGINKLDHDLLLVNSLVELSYTLWRMDNLSEGLQNIDNSENIINQLLPFGKESIPKLKRVKGNLIALKGDNKKSVEICKNGLISAEEVGDKLQEAGLTYNIAAHYWEDGENDKALEYWKDSLRLYREIDNQSGVTSSQITIANIQFDRGEYDKALAVYKETLELSQKFNDKQNIAWSLGNISAVYREMGKFDKAMEFAIKFQDISKEMGKEMISPLSLISRLHILQNQREKAEPLLYQMEQFASETQNQESKLLLLYTNGIYFNSSNRNRDKVEAEKFFQEFVTLSRKAKTMHRHRIKAKIYLTEILLDEFRLYGEKEVFEEISSLISGVSDTLREQHSYHVLVSVLILQSKLKIIEKEFKVANQLLEEAADMAKKRNMGLYENHINRTLIELQSSFKEMKNMVSTNTSYSEIIDKMEIMEYLKQAQDMVRTS